MSAHDRILEIFRKNDTDGSGSISREELAAVLKSLDPEDFDPGSLDKLLCFADASGDGELQAEEFVTWLFAEDGKVVKPGVVSYIIENCPTPGLDGEYVQQEDKFYGHRPVYYSGLARKYLFYHVDHQQWQIYTRTSTRALARLKTIKAPSSLLSTWEVREATTGTYSEASWMSCRPVGAPTSVEEMIERAPHHIYVQAIDSKIHGGFSKNDMAWNDRPSFFNKVDKTFLCYDKEQMVWAVCTNPRDFGTSLVKSSQSEIWSPELIDWEEVTVMAIDPKSNFAKEIEKKHAATEAGKKEEKKEVKVKREENGSEIVKEKLDLSQTWTLDTFWNPGKEDEPGFIDPEFPHTLQSLFEPGLLENSIRFRGWIDTPVEWVRAIYLQGDEKPRLFDRIEPASVCQGHLGDCWLIAAFAAVAEFPYWIEEHVFVTKGLPEDGKYEIRLYDWVAKEWKIITVDDRIPCYGRKELQMKPATCFAKLAGGGIYIPLLEKAFAKVSCFYSKKHTSCYGHLDGGDSTGALIALTGETNFLRWERSIVDNKWTISCKDGVLVRKEKGSGEKLGRLSRNAGVIETERDGYFIKFRKLYGDGPSEGWFSCYHRGKPTAKLFCEEKDTDWSCGIVAVPENVWPLFPPFKRATDENLDSQGMWKKIREYDDANYIMTAAPSGNRARLGLVASHIYSVLRAVEIQDFQLICCRNPWGRGEWNGPWGDNSEEWTTNPEVAKALKIAERQDGIFWMDWNDFHAHFYHIGVCPKSMPTKRGDFDVNKFGDED